MSTVTPVRLRPAIRRATFLDGSNLTDSSAAAAEHYINSVESVQNRVDLRRMRECRLVVVRRGNAAAAGYTVELKYSTAYQATASNLVTIGQSAVSVNASGKNAIHETGWVRLLSAARADVVVAPVASGGNGTASPNVGLVYAEFR